MKKNFINQSKLFILVIFLFSCGLVLGQGEANIWYFGAGAGLNFNGGGPVLLTGGGIQNGGVEGEGCSAISDASGNLLFYTDGKTVYTRTHTVMPNGAGDLLGDKSSTQSAVIFAVPGSATRYYIFTAPVTNSNNRTRYSIVNMALNGGLGDIEAANKNVIMPGCPAYMMEALTSVPSDIAGQFWVISHAAANPGSVNTTQAYYAWEVSASGIAAPVVSNVGYALPQGTLVGPTYVSQGQGFIKSNTCFNKLFTSYFAQGAAAGAVEIHNFDKSTGTVSGPTIQITNFDNRNEIYSLEVSPNDRYLYVSELGQGSVIAPGDERVHQFDLSGGTAVAINASRVTLMTSAPTAAQTGFPPGMDFVRTGHLQLAPNGKIYVSQHSFSGTIGQLSVINTPNNAACGFQHYPAALKYTSGTGTTHGLPQFPRQFVAGSLNISASTTSICLNSTPSASINLSYTFSGSLGSIVWSTNGGGTFSPSTTDATPTVTYTTSGTKRVVLTLTDICLNVYRDTVYIVVNDLANATGSATCGNPITLNVTSTPTSGNTYVWYSDAAGTTPIATGVNPTIPAPYTGNIYVRQVGTVTVTPTVVTPAQPAATTLMSEVNMTVAPPGAGSDPTTSRNTTFTTSVPVTLNSFNFFTEGQWCCGTVNVSYTVIIRNTTTNAVVSTGTSSGNTDFGAGANTVNINGSSRKRFTYAPGGGVALPAGNYRIEIIKLSGGTAGTNILNFGFGGLLTNTITGAASNTGSTSSSNSFATDISISTPAIPAVMTNVITSTPKLCANMSPAIAVNCVLPVTWLDFEATRTEGTSVLLEWSTLTEDNSKGFYIQRSLDGVNFETIGYVTAAGNSSSIKYYEYVDHSAPLTAVYYKIKEEDLDGLTMRSSPKYVSALGTLELTLVPNPGNGNFKIVGLAGDTKLTVNILSVTGQSISTVTTYPGETVDLTGFAKGFYVIQILAGNSIQSIRFINQ